MEMEAPRKRILIIEDEAPMRRNIALLLEIEGFEVTTAENGERGIEAAHRDRPDLIVCDVMMPEVDGYGVVQSLRAESEFFNTPFIFLSAKGSRPEVRIGMNFGADDYLTKPVIREDLLTAIEARLSRAQACTDRLESLRSGGVGGLPEFSSPLPLQRALGLTPREAEVLLWVAQGKSNADVGNIIGCSEKTVKQHISNIFDKLGVENRTAASLAAIEALVDSGASGTPA